MGRPSSGPAAVSATGRQPARRPPADDHTDPSTVGLQLRVRKTAAGRSRTWLFRYTWRGKGVRIVIGHYPAMHLADARARALEFRKAIGDGIDPRRTRPRRQAATEVHGTGPAVPHTVGHPTHEFMERYVKVNRKRPEDAE